MMSLYDQNREFNEALEETYEQVVVGKYKFSPADVLFNLDEIAYEQELLCWKQKKKEYLIELANEALDYPCNKQRFEKLVKVVGEKKIVPFIGAGLSIPCGNPGWRAFLLKLSKMAEMDCIEIEKRLDNGKYEELAEELIDKLGVPGFNEKLDNAFATSKKIRESVLLIPKLTRGSVITTNIDTILERAFQIADCPFQDMVIGNQQSEFIKALATGDRHLLKLHGNVSRTQSRVLTKSEYCDAYGSEEIDFNRPLPKALSRVFSHYSLLFLGCSLGHDRTMDLFYDVVKKLESDLPSHYAIVERPEDDNNISEREKFLNDRKIFPIWYPHEKHEYVEAFLTLLIKNK